MGRRCSSPTARCARRSPASSSPRRRSRARSSRRSRPAAVSRAPVSARSSTWIRSRSRSTSTRPTSIACGRTQPAQAVLDAYPDWNIPAHVIAIIPTADRNKATVKVRVALDQKDPRILPDMGVRVSFLEPENARDAAGTSGPAGEDRRAGAGSALVVRRRVRWRGRCMSSRADVARARAGDSPARPSVNCVRSPGSRPARASCGRRRPGCTMARASASRRRANSITQGSLGGLA